MHHRGASRRGSSDHTRQQGLIAAPSMADQTAIRRWHLTHVSSLDGVVHVSRSWRSVCLQARICHHLSERQTNGPQTGFLTASFWPSRSRQRNFTVVSQLLNTGPPTK